MSEPTSKFPDIKEVMGMATKLFKDVQKSVTEIACEYKEKRKAAEEEAAHKPAPTPPVPPMQPVVPEEPVKPVKKEKTTAETKTSHHAEDSETK